MRWLIILLLCSGCSKENVAIRQYDDTTTQYLKDPKPIQFEFADEYGLKKEWTW